MTSFKGVGATEEAPSQLRQISFPLGKLPLTTRSDITLVKLTKKILNLLETNPGATAREIARQFKEKKHEINSRLYKLKGRGLAYPDADYRWYLGSPATTQASPAQSGMSIAPQEARPCEYAPTSEQLAVVSAPHSARLFVEAGPGTGKTDTLVARLKHLMEVGGLRPPRCWSSASRSPL